MKIEPLTLKTELHSKTLTRKIDSFDRLLKEMEKEELPSHIINMTNEEVTKINSFKWTEKDLSKKIYHAQNKITKQLEKELKLVTKNHYRNLWMVLGMSAFGLPLGVAFGVSLGQMSLLAIGLPIGMGVGIAVGSYMDKKAKEEGRQMDVDLR